MVTKYQGREQWDAFVRDMHAMNEADGTISPGGASRMLRMARQSVYALVERDANVKALAFYEDRKRYAEVYEINVRDLLRWGVATGRIKEDEDIGLPFYRVMQIYDQVKEEIAQGRLQLADTP